MNEVDARALLAALDAVPAVAYCYCGRSKNEHTFYNDRIYDVQGFTCPGGWGEFRYDAIRTRDERTKARVALLMTALATVP